MEWNRTGSNLAQIFHMAQNYFSFRFIGTQVIEESNIILHNNFLLTFSEVFWSPESQHISFNNSNNTGRTQISGYFPFHSLFYNFPDKKKTKVQ